MVVKSEYEEPQHVPVLRDGGRSDDHSLSQRGGLLALTEVKLSPL
jgi:hypothetical protein